MSYIKRLICTIFDHRFETYIYAPKWAYHITDCEQAGICIRCGYDTHK
jgi:hypothetical protein